MSLWAGDAFSDYCGLGLKTDWKWVFAFLRTALEGHFKARHRAQGICAAACWVCDTSWRCRGGCDPECLWDQLPRKTWTDQAQIKAPSVVSRVLYWDPANHFLLLGSEMALESSQGVTVGLKEE